MSHAKPAYEELERRCREAEALLEAHDHAAHQELISTLESISDAFFALDDDLVVTYCNAAAERQLGRDAGEVVGKPLFDAFPEARGSIFEAKYREAIRTRQPTQFETYFDIAPYRNWYEVRVYPRDKGISVYFLVTTDRKRAEEERAAIVRVLGMLNSISNLHELMREVAAFLADWSGCDAVGIRLREGEDYPYFETRGFSTEFVQIENRLCAVGEEGMLIRDSQGKPVLECMCGNILCGRVDPRTSFFTASGSFWTNRTSALLATTTETELMTRTRNRCNREGYESVALIPLRTGGETLGLLQFNDKREGRFTPELLAFLEQVASNLAIGLARYKAAVALHESERFARATLDGLSAHIAIVNEQGVVEAVNKAWREFAAANGLLSADVCVGTNYLEICERACGAHAEGAAEFAQAVRDVLAGRRSRFEMEYPCHSPDEPRWFVAQVTRFPGDGPARAVIAHENVTERKQAEKALHKSRADLDHALALAHVGNWSWDVENDIVSWSSEMYRIYGVDPEAFEHTLNGVARLIHPEDLPRQIQSIEALLAGRTFDPFEYRVVRPDGGIRVVQVFTADVERNASGQPVRMFGAAQDITERKRAEEALQARESLLRTVVDNTPFEFWARDLEERCFMENAPLVRHWGSLLGTRPEDCAASPAEVALWKANNRRALAGEVVNEEVTYVVAGEERTFQNIVAPIRINGEIRGILGVNGDVTARKRAEKERERLQEQLLQAQKMESIGRLAGGVAHDFNNMLSVILGHVEMALPQVSPDQPLRADLLQIQKAAQRSADLTRQLLTFARKQTVSPEVLNLNDAVSNMLKMLQRLIGEDVELIFRPGAELWPVKMDPIQCDQILANLSINARDAMPEGGKLIIETKNTVLDDRHSATHADSVPGDYMQLTVSDTGTGMDKATREHLFEPFFTTKEVGKGTGLGLATIYGIIRQNNGFITVHSEPGRGTTFQIYLPRHVGEIAEAREVGRAQAADRGRETLLLVEDEPAILNIARTMLEQLGYRVLAANSPREAIRLAETHVGEIHLLITDVVMPEMNGHELARRLLSLKPDLKCLFISGYTADVIAHHGVLEGGVHFIQKPFTMTAMAAKVRELVHGG